MSKAQISDELRERVMNSEERPSIRFRHFKVTSGPILNELQRLLAIKKEAFLAAQALKEEVGAISSAWYRDAWLFAFSESVRNTETFGALWRKVHTWDGKSYFAPRRNTKVGREIAKKIKKLPAIPDHNDALKVVDLPTYPAVTEGNRWYAPVVWGWYDEPMFFVKVPWRDFDPELLSAYRAMRDAGEYGSASLDFALWQPHPSMQEIPEWEALKATEEHKAAKATEDA